MGGCRATGDAAGGMSGGTMEGVVIRAGTESTAFRAGALGVDVAELLAFVALDRFTDVFADGDPVAEDKDAIL